MENISSKVIAIVIAIIVGASFLPLLQNWDLVTSSITEVNAILAILPILLIIGFGLSLRNRKNN